MNHLKMFEDHEPFSLKGHFKDKINWQLFNYLEDKLTHFSDKGYYTHVLVKAVVDDARCTLYHSTHLENQKHGEGWLTSNTKMAETYLDSIRSLEYEAYVKIPRDIESDGQLFEEMANTVLERFHICSHLVRSDYLLFEENLYG